MIQIYAPGNENFNVNGDITLLPTEATVHAVLNGEWSATLTQPIDDDGRWQYVQKNAVVKMPSFLESDSYDGMQLFRIVSTETSDDGVTAEMQPIFFDAANDAWLDDVRPTELSGEDALLYMIAGSTAPDKYTAESDISAPYTAYYEYQNLLTAISGDIDQAFINRWGGEILYDNFKIIIDVEAGEDNGVEVRYGKNIPENGMTIEEDMSEVVTRIYPKAYNGRTLSENDGYVDSPLIDEYPTVRNATITFEYIKLAEDCNTTTDDDGNETIDEDDDIIVCETQDELDEELIAACNEQFNDGIDKPSVAISIEMILLQNTDQYQDIQMLEEVSLGDTISCINTHLNYETSARVVELEYDVLQQKVTSVVIGDYEDDYVTDTATTVASLQSTLTDLTAETVEFENTITQNLYAMYASIYTLEAEYADIDELTSRVATIETLYVSTEYVTELLANYVMTEELSASIAEIMEAYVTTAYITELLAGYASISSLEAATADISQLVSDVANITTILSGAIGTGTLETVYLTSENVVIEDALITDAMIASLSASKITAGTIYTSLVTIQTSSDSQALYITDSLIQMRDSGGITRLQLGLDGEGNYNYYIFDESENILFDALGIYGEGIHEGVIVDDHVAEKTSTYAGISGSKLDIDSVITSINEDGTVTIDGSSVTIDGETLDYKLTTINTSLDNAITGYTAYYCLWESATEAPPNYDEVAEGAYLDISAYLDYFYLDIAENTLWTTTYTAPEDGQYVWRTYVLKSSGGTTVYGEPALITGDDVARTQTETLTTELTVVQGNISALIEYTEIEEWESAGTTIYQAYSALTVTLDSIKSEVSSVQTEVSDFETTLTEKVSTLEQTIDGFEAQVEAIVSLSGENIEEVLEQIATVSATVSGLTSTVSEVSTTVSTLDGYYSALSSEVSELSQTVEGFEATVSSLQTTVSENYTELSTSILEIEATAESLSSTITTVQTYATKHYGTCTTAAATASKTVTCSDFELYTGAVIMVYFTYANTASSPTLNVNGTGAKTIYAYGSTLSSSSNYNWTAYSTVTFIYSGSYWRIADSASMSKIVQTADSLTVDIEDLQSNARTYFKADTTSITVSSGVVTFSSNTFAVSSTYFTLTKTGALTATSATITGAITAVSGSVYAILKNGRLLMHYGDSTTVTAYVSGYTYYASTGRHGLRLAGYGIISLLAPYIGVGAWTSYGNDATVTLGQSGSTEYYMHDFDVTWATTYIYINTSGNLKISTSEPSSYSSYVSFSRPTGFSWKKTSITFTKGLMTTSL